MLLPLALSALLGVAPVPTASDRITGTYSLAGTAHVSVSPFPAHEYPGDLTATLARDPGSGVLSLRLEATGYACTLHVRAESDGSLQFPESATCPLDVSEPNARGHVDTQVRTARGRVRNDRLEISLQLDVSGRVQLKIPSKTIRVLGSEIQTPATWAPSAPVHGTVAASGQGSRKVSPTR